METGGNREPFLVIGVLVLMLIVGGLGELLASASPVNAARQTTVNVARSTNRVVVQPSSCQPPGSVSALPICYISQFANSPRNEDCGPTALAMVAQFLLGRPNGIADGAYIDEMRHRIAGATHDSTLLWHSAALSLPQLEAGIGTLGLTYSDLVPTDTFSKSDILRTLRQGIAYGHPAIALISAAGPPLNRNYDGHFWVIAGFSTDGTQAWVLDPDSLSTAGQTQGGFLRVAVADLQQVLLQAAIVNGSTRDVGGINVPAYCQSIGQVDGYFAGPTVFDWYCRSTSGANSAFSWDSACQWQYQTSYVKAGFADYYNLDPTSWQCYGRTMPGGVWMGPPDGSTSSGVVHFQASASPPDLTAPPVDRINFTIDWPGRTTDPHARWVSACVAYAAAGTNEFSCDADLGALGAPQGQVQVSFDVYDAAGDGNLAPNGIHTIMYSVPTAWSVTLSTSNTTPALNKSATLTATSSQDVQPNPDAATWLYILDQTTGQVICTATTGHTCSSTQVFDSATTHTYIARVDSSNIIGDTITLAQSSPVVVSWSPPWSVALTVTNTTPRVGQSVTLTASPSASLTGTGFSVRIWDLVNGSASTSVSCTTGDTCSVNVTDTSPNKHTFWATVNAPITSNAVSTSGNLTVIWRSAPCSAHHQGDLNGDGKVDLTDFSIFAADYGKSSGLNNPCSDINGDGKVDLTDFSIFASNYGWKSGAKAFRNAFKSLHNSLPTRGLASESRHSSGHALRLEVPRQKMAVGDTLSIPLTLDSSQAFNAAQATVSVPASLSLQSITPGDCNPTFVHSPTLADPSFAGATLSDSKTYCTMYTLVLKVVSAAGGTPSLSDVDLLAPPDGASILSSVGCSASGCTLIGVPPAVDHFDVTGPSNATSGNGVGITVIARDAGGRLVPWYGGTVHLTSTDSKAALPSDYTFTSSEGGSHLFTVTFKTAGVQKVTATDAATGSITGTSAGTAVAPAAAAKLQVQVPGGATAGSPVDLTVTALDPFGNTVTGYTGTVRFSGGGPHAVLPQPYTFQSSDNGTHTFSGGALLKDAGNQKITATGTSTGSITGTSGIIAVSPASANHFSITGPPSTMSGSAFSVTVTARDAYGNVATGYAGIAHFGSSDGLAVLPRDYTFVTGDAGVHTFSGVILKTLQAQTVRVSDTRAPSIAGSLAVTVTPQAVNLLTNGGFETGFSGWVKAGLPRLTATVHTGSHALLLCGSNWCNDQVSQAVTLPATYSSLKLSLWYYISTSDRTLVCSDHLYVRISTATGTTITTPVSLCNGNSTSNWVQAVVDESAVLSAYKGKRVQVVLLGTTNGMLPTSFYLDDISLTATPVRHNLLTGEVAALSQQVTTMLPTAPLNTPNVSRQGLQVCGRGTCNQQELRRAVAGDVMLQSNSRLLRGGAGRGIIGRPQ